MPICATDERSPAGRREFMGKSATGWALPTPGCDAFEAGRTDWVETHGAGAQAISTEYFPAGRPAKLKLWRLRVAGRPAHRLYRRRTRGDTKALNIWIAVPKGGLEYPAA